MLFTAFNLVALLLSLVVTFTVLNVIVPRSEYNCITVISGHSAYSTCPPSAELAEVLKFLKPHQHG
nr:triple gene block 3 protein [Plantago yellow mosaic virus]